MRTSDTTWRGVYPAVTTQFHDDETLDLTERPLISKC